MGEVLDGREDFYKVSINAEIVIDIPDLAGRVETQVMAWALDGTVASLTQGEEVHEGKTRRQRSAAYQYFRRIDHGKNRSHVLRDISELSLLDRLDIRHPWRARGTQKGRQC